MIHAALLCSFLTAGLAAPSFLRTLNQKLDCNQPGLNNCKMNNCSVQHEVVPRQLAPTKPEWGPDILELGLDEHGPVPVLNVTWRIRSDASMLALQGSQVQIVDQDTKQSLCVRFTYSIHQQLTPSFSKWTFWLDGVVLDAGHSYLLSAFNLPQPHVGEYRITKHFTVPGCDDKRIQKAQMCLENGSMWHPALTAAVSLPAVVVGFEADKYCDLYQVSIESESVHLTKNVSKANNTSLNVTFVLDVSQLLKCQLTITITPFFIRCQKESCRPEQRIINHCLCKYYSPRRTVMIKSTLVLVIVGVCFACLLWKVSSKDPVTASSSAADEHPESFQVPGRRQVLIIYSLDHPLYKNIVLKLCAFLTAKCGIQVVLDQLDSTRLGILGRVQWLDWQREQMETSSAKILVLCSAGVQAKWRAMCGEKPVLLKSDQRSPSGDMLTPALSLIVPRLVRSASLEKYIVAYFEDISSPEDVPSPFNVTVRYKLMKQFEELFFRILDAEKHGPGRVRHIQGLSEEEYHRCPLGGALQEAIEAFREYQVDHPHWFEEEWVDD
ncbi:interleukin-17 receptor A-like [Entelurus aequoreus]|uniref:interleukin-17 receptor A-like n=1 Tax=Entelurus aequoreus TaxID=161455 RepID=UPI002B1DCA9A|nr:interleukin-17 receptor A-like [Entelurus aequoreus]